MSIKNAIATSYDGTTPMLSMTTVGALTANIGDHIELRLRNTPNSSIMSEYV